MSRALRLLGALGMVVLTVLGAPSAHATSTICVALVVDDADLGGGVHTSCAKVSPGATGYDVLRAGGHTFTVCSNGVLGTIDGKPADGCHVKDNTHYWSYWHRAPGAAASAWTYSDEGAGTYQPRNTSTEGWVWQNGASRKPAAVPYSSICQPAPTPAPTPTRAPRHRTAISTTMARPSAEPSTPVTTSTARPHASAVATASQTSSPSAASASPKASPTQSTVTEPDPHSSSAPTPALLAGVGVAAAIGAAAVVVQRRSR